MNKPGLCLPLLLVACSDGPDTRGQKIYRPSLGGAPTSLDPVQSATAYANHVVVNVYDTLYAYKYLKRPYELKPNLAEGMPEVSEDGLTYIIRIQPDVHFIDDPAFPDGKGREVTAEDFVYSMKRHFDPKSRSQGNWLWAGKIRGMEEWKKAGADYAQEVEGLLALDRYTVQIRLTRPFPQLVHTLAQGFSAIVPHEAVDYYGREFSVHPVGSGPFRLQTFDSVRAVLVRNSGFRREPISLKFEGYDEAVHGKYGIAEIEGRIPPLVDRLEIHFIKESLSRWNSFTKGDEIQYATIPKELLDEVLAKKQPEVKLKPAYARRYFMSSGLENGFVHTDFNMKDPLIGYNEDKEREKRNHALRCAIRYAWDWAERNRTFYNDMGFVFPGIIPPMVPEYDPHASREALEHNPDKGRRLLEENGWTPENLPTLTLGGVASVDSRQMFEQFRGWLLRIGYPKEKINFDAYASFGDYNRAVKHNVINLRKPEALVTLNNVLLDSANQQIAQQRWRGLRVLAVDGSTGRLPDFLAIEEYFGKPSGSGVPLARFSRLFDVLNDQILHADMVPYATGERELAAEYLLYSSPDDLFLYDRGYPAFWLFAFHAQEQRHYCARVRHDFHSEVKAFVADGAKERIVVLTPNFHEALAAPLIMEDD